MRKLMIITLIFIVASAFASLAGMGLSGVDILVMLFAGFYLVIALEENRDDD